MIIYQKTAEFRGIDLVEAKRINLGCQTREERKGETYKVMKILRTDQTLLYKSQENLMHAISRIDYVLVLKKK